MAEHINFNPLHVNCRFLGPYTLYTGQVKLSQASSLVRWLNGIYVAARPRSFTKFSHNDSFRI